LAALTGPGERKLPPVSGKKSTRFDQFTRGPTESP